MACIALVLSAVEACSATSSAERSMLRADAEAFEAVVREQTPPNSADSTLPPHFLRVDSRPGGDEAVIATAPQRANGFDLDEAGDSLSAGALARIGDQRKAILRDLQIDEGGPFVYPGCGGSKARGSSDSAFAPTGANCPREWRRYVTVGLPYRGVAAVLAKLRAPESAPPDSTGEVWTVLVTENSIGPGGQDWRQFAWLLRRDPVRGRVNVAEKFLVSWAE
ncbi:MAG: hypothetical protein ABJB95_04700 [Gemmatimonadales bacterium]